LGGGSDDAEELRARVEERGQPFEREPLLGHFLAQLDDLEDQIPDVARIVHVA
jgi:cell fate (sporulation/competence/biofilm development) regulator YlbF (YheA/YmcA/DUF963 family)